MTANIIFDRSLIAPCGMNCGTCIAYLRQKNRCEGCNRDSDRKSITRERCIIKTCTEREKTVSKSCPGCDTFPCKRLKQLDKRYRTKYGVSFIQNLLMIEEKGMEKFLVFESERRTCPECGSVLSVHRSRCLKCDRELKNTFIQA